MFRIPRSLLAVLLLLAAPAVLAQTLTIGETAGRRGGTVDVPVSFTAGAAPVTAFQLEVVYPAGVFGTPTCIALGGAVCSVHPSSSGGRILILRFDFLNRPLPSQAIAVLRFPILASAARGTRARLGIGAPNLFKPDATEASGTFYSGYVDIR